MKQHLYVVGTQFGTSAVISVALMTPCLWLNLCFYELHSQQQSSHKNYKRLFGAATYVLIQYNWQLIRRLFLNYTSNNYFVFISLTHTV